MAKGNDKSEQNVKFSKGGQSKNARKGGVRANDSSVQDAVEPEHSSSASNRQRDEQRIQTRDSNEGKTEPGQLWSSVIRNRSKHDTSKNEEFPLLKNVKFEKDCRKRIDRHKVTQNKSGIENKDKNITETDTKNDKSKPARTNSQPDANKAKGSKPERDVVKDAASKSSKPDSQSRAITVTKEVGASDKPSKKTGNRSKIQVTSALTQHRNPHKKKRSAPIFVNLEDALNVNKNKKRAQASRGAFGKFQRRLVREHLSGNLLDSSNPRRNKGKQRETKKRKLTNLKLKIIKERILKQRARETGNDGTECADFRDLADLKGEIDRYLREASRRKAEATERREKVKVEKGTGKAEEKGERRDKSGGAEASVTEGKPDKPELLCFTSKFREYCENLVTPALNAAVSALIKDLVSLQDRAYYRDPIKAKARRRHVSGFKEVKKYFTLKKVKMVIVAPNLEKLMMEGSLYDVVKDVKAQAESQGVPCVFALDRHKLGRCAKKTAPVSAFAVVNYEGLEDKFDAVMEHFATAQKDFQDMLAKMTKKDDEGDVNDPLLTSILSVCRETVNKENQVPADET